MPEPALSPERYALAVITDDADLFRDIRKLLATQFRTTLASSEDDIKSILELPDLNAILFDLDCIGDGPADGLDVLAELRKLRDDVVLFTFSRSNNRTLPLKAAQAGADEFFLHPLIFAQLHIVLSRVIEKRALELEGRRLLQQVEDKSAFYGLIGGSAAMQKIYQAVEAVTSTGASVVLRGESGVGKELVARAIVQCGDRADHPFVCLNCSALPETLMESELFGYEKGAFTGADTAKPGMVELAHTGTSSSTKSPPSTPACKANSFAFCRSIPSSASAAAPPARSISASSPRPMTTSRTSSAKAASAKTSTSASTLCPSSSRPSANARATSLFFWTTSCASIAPPPKSL